MQVLAIWESLLIQGPPPNPEMKIKIANQEYDMFEKVHKMCKYSDYIYWWLSARLL